jgi:crossover junction endodeoxyribonuclease RuvC
MIPRTVHIVGLDMSLASTGVATLGYTPDGRWTTFTYSIPTAGRDSDPEPCVLDRMDYVISSAATAAERADVIAIERPAFAARGSATATLAGLWWLTYRKIMRYEVPVVIISASSAKKYATGHGGAAKRDVSRATVRMFPDYETKSGDEDDALIMAAVGADLAGLPVPWERTKYRRDALAAITRPDNLEPLA